MKKLSLLMALILLLSCIPVAVTAYDPMYEITFFTNDEHVWLIEHFPFGDPNIENWETLTPCYSITILMDEGYTISFDDIPGTAIFLGGADYSVEWTGDPVGAVVTDNMSFEAVIADRPEEVHNVSFISCDREPITLPSLMTYEFMEITLGFEDGYTLTESDMPCLPMIEPGSEPHSHHIEWSPEAIGQTVLEDMEFEAVMTLNSHFRVRFMTILHDHIFTYEDVPLNSAVTPPEPPDYDGLVFTGWDSDSYEYVNCNMTIYAMYFQIGDANTDASIDSGDAALILRYSVSLINPDIVNFDELCDYNRDGHADTGDAVGALRFSVGV